MSGKEPLGYAHSSERVILPFVVVCCDRVELFVSRTDPFIRSTRGSDVFGRALGPVLAREIYHVLTGSAEHTSFGVIKSVVTAADLVGARDENQRRLERQLIAALLASVRGVGSLRPQVQPESTIPAQLANRKE